MGVVSVGFSADPAVPLTEHNKRAAGARSVGGPPVIYEAAYRYGNQRLNCWFASRVYSPQYTTRRVCGRLVGLQALVAYVRSLAK